MDSDMLSDAMDDGFSSSDFLNDPNLLPISSNRLTSDTATHEDGFTDELPSHDLRSVSNQAGAVIAKIEKIFESIADSLLDGKNSMTIPLKTRPQSKASRDEANSGVKNITFPTKSAREAWRFTVLLRILELSHEALTTGVVTTKRDIYYRDPELFTKQTVVDRYVDDIAYTFGVDRQALNVVAAAKGLIAGAFTATRKDGAEIVFTEPEGLLIPNSSSIGSLQLDGICWILVIEKEATFRTLAASKYWETSLAGPGIIITAKGYPDIQTRRFLHLLSTTAPIPIFALVDYDPDGLTIMSTYKHGSISLAHEKDVAVPSIRWLGIRSPDFLKTESDVPGLLTLTKRDRRIAGLMLGRSDEGSEEEGVEWRRELQTMLMLNVKAEIQILGGGEMLGEWLDGKLTEMI